MDRGQVRVRALRRREQALVHGRNAQEERARQAALSCQYQRSVEFGEHSDRRSQAQARQEANREAEGMEEGKDAVEDLGPLVEDRYPRDRFFDIGHEVGVRECGGLWDACRSTRVNEQGDVVHGARAAALPGGGRAHRARPGARPAGTRACELLALLACRLHGQLQRQARGRGQRRRQVHGEGGVAAPEEREFLEGFGPRDRHACAVTSVLAF